MFLDSVCSCLRTIYRNQVFSGEWRCSWSSADRRCSNYIWWINNFIAYPSEAYIRDMTVNYGVKLLGALDCFNGPRLATQVGTMEESMGVHDVCSYFEIEVVLCRTNLLPTPEFQITAYACLFILISCRSTHTLFGSTHLIKFVSGASLLPC